MESAQSIGDWAQVDYQSIYQWFYIGDSAGQSSDSGCRLCYYITNGLHKNFRRDTGEFYNRSRDVFGGQYYALQNIGHREDRDSTKGQCGMGGGSRDGPGIILPQGFHRAADWTCRPAGVEDVSDEDRRWRFNLRSKICNWSQFEKASQMLGDINYSCMIDFDNIKYGSNRQTDDGFIENWINNKLCG